MLKWEDNQVLLSKKKETQNRRFPFKFSVIIILKLFWYF